MIDRRALAGVWRKLAGTGTGAGTALGLLVLVTVFVAMAVPRGSVSQRTRALQHTLAELPVGARTVTASTNFTSFAEVAGPNDPPGEMAANLQLQSQTLETHGMPIEAAASWCDLTVGGLTTSGAAASAYYGDAAPLFQLSYRDALRRNAKLVTGTWPQNVTNQGGTAVLQAAVTATTAARFRLAVGSRLDLTPGLAIQVSGIIRPVAPSTAFWQELGGSLGAYFFRTNDNGFWTGSAFVGPGETGAMLTPGDTPSAQVTWVHPLNLSGVGADQAAATLRDIDSATQQISASLVTPDGNTAALSVTSGADQTLTSFISTQDSINSILSLLFVSLAVLGIVVLLLCAQLLVERRADEFALMRARGAKPWQVGWLVVRGGLLVTAPATLVAIGLAIVMTPGGDDPQAWWLAAATVFAGLVGPALLAWRRALDGRRRSRGPRALGRIAALRRLVVEAMLTCLAVAGLIVLRQEGLSATGSLNALASAAPILVAVPVAIVVVRMSPAVLGWLQRLAGRRRGVVAFVGLVRGAPRTFGAVLPVFALVLALAVVTFGGTVRSAVNRGEQAAAWEQTGADAVVGSPGATIPLTEPARHAMAAVRGVRLVAPVLELLGANGPNQAMGSVINVAVVDPNQYAALLARTPAPRFPAAELARPAGHVAALPVIASPQAAALLRSTNYVATINYDIVHVVVRGVLDGTPAATPGEPFMVLPTWAIPTNLPPTMMLLSGSHIDQKKLSAVVARMAPSATVTFRQVVQHSLATAPLPRAAYLTYVAGSVTAALFSVLVVLIALLLGARTRELTDARLATMGLSDWQASKVGIVEAIPLIVAAAAGGVIAASALVPLVGPALNLSLFTQAPDSVHLEPDLVALAISAAGLVALALATLAGQAAAAHRRGIARALRVDE